jgi:hypothetical protein
VRVSKPKEKALKQGMIKSDEYIAPNAKSIVNAT